jgi:SAM-dependent methyltransferase
MGLDTPAVKWLFGAKARGVDFSELATLGRQAFFPEPNSLQSIFDRLSLGLDAQAFLRESDGYAEKFFRILGAGQVTSFDKSDYQVASSLHDMNAPIDASLKNRFSVVLDAGTIEHVFNFPQAIRNCMDMVKVGGHFIQVTVANNFIGHGFYQFSPELMYRVFSQENGFEAEAVVLHEMFAAGKWYRMHDAVALGHRVELTTRSPSYLLTLARKTADVPVFAAWPQQSDYVVMWQAFATGSPAPPPRSGAALRGMRHLVPDGAVRAIRRLCGPGVNSAVDRLTDEAVLHGRF